LSIDPLLGPHRQGSFFVVEDSFCIKGRGLILVPGIVARPEERFRIGDPIEGRRPDGTIVPSRIDGMERFTPPLPDSAQPILLKNLGKDDVPVGTEIWSVDI
jgi:hypothetical protein